MIRLKTVYADVPASVLYDVLHDPDYRRTWDKFMMEAEEIGYLNPNNSVSYYALSCPAPVKNRDFVIQSSWLQTPGGDYAIINHSVFHGERPGRKGFVRGTSFLTGFLVTPLSSGCRLGYVTHTDPRGRLPTWVSNKLSTSFAPKLARRLHKACLKYEAWKRGNSWKPWLYPEQTLDAPRINIKDCRRATAKADGQGGGSSGGSSPDEFICEDWNDTSAAAAAAAAATAAMDDLEDLSEPEDASPPLGECR